MRTIQDVGREILSGTPASLYFMVGAEYGIKLKYIDLLAHHYGHIEYYDNIMTIIDMMSVKRIIPMQPCVYVVRYDFDFISNLSDRIVKKLNKCKIIGTIVCLYEDSKSTTKLDKYFPDFTVSIDAVDKQYLIKYLCADFPDLPNIIISNVVVPYCYNYYDAQLLCIALSSIPTNEYCSLPPDKIIDLFGHKTQLSDQYIKMNFVARNFYGLCQILENYADEPSSILYTVLSALLELEKIVGNKYVESDIKQYTHLWTRADIYHMFIHTYDCLKKLRTISADSKTLIMQLFTLLKFNPVPANDL